MDESYLINGSVIYFPGQSRLVSKESPFDEVNLNLPVNRCLHLLIENKDKVISKNDILEKVWHSNGVFVAENTFYQNVSLLRKSLKQAGLTQDIIVTCRRKGFCIASETNIEKIPEDAVSLPEKKNGTFCEQKSGAFTRRGQTPPAITLALAGVYLLLGMITALQLLILLEE